MVSRGSEAPDGVALVHSLEEAYELAEATNLERCFVMGGGQIYAQAIADVDRLVVTHVHTVIEDADTFFPPIDPTVWQVAERSEMTKCQQRGCPWHKKNGRPVAAVRDSVVEGLKRENRQRSGISGSLECVGRKGFTQASS